MGRVAGRDADDTRRIILDAATELFARRGVGVSLAEIAETAGVSKGGLVYHFASKDDLVRAGALHLFERFRQAVHNEADAESEGTPGRLARGYIRASFAEAGGQDIRDLISVSAQLMADPEVRELSDADGRRWREELSADGLAPEVIRIIVAATDGVSSAPLWGSVLDADDQRALEAELIAMTRR
ncbi:MAG: TetR/AcrR family transcriptional regulator [Microbacterium sp.]